MSYGGSYRDRDYRDDRGDYGRGAPPPPPRGGGYQGRGRAYAQPPRRSGPLPGAQSAGYTLFVGGLSDAVRSADVAAEFERYGQLVRVDIPLRNGRSKGFAFVEFIYKQDCEKALAATRGRLRIDGKPVTVELTQRDFMPAPPRALEPSASVPHPPPRSRSPPPLRRDRSPPPRDRSPLGRDERDRDRDYRDRERGRERDYYAAPSRNPRSRSRSPPPRPRSRSRSRSRSPPPRR